MTKRRQCMLIIGVSTIIFTLSIQIQAFVVVLQKPCHGRSRTRQVVVVPKRIRRIPRHRRYQNQREYEQNNDTNEDGDEDYWKAGDVYRDLDRLEQAINFANAEQNLAHQERLETLNFIAEQRRPILPDIVQYIIRPISLSLILTIVLLQTRTGPTMSRILKFASSVHFWGLVVAAPLLFLCMKRITTKSDPVPTDLKRLDPQYYSYLTTIDWEDPKTSCRDVVLCLLEQWSSAVIGIALTHQLIGNENQILPWIVRIVVRHGAYAALHQYPKLWYELIQKGQPRPIQSSTYFLQTLVRVHMLPWFVAIDSAILFATVFGSGMLYWSHIGLGYSVGLGTAALAAVTTQLMTPRHPILVQLVERRPPIRAMIKAFLLVWIMNRRQNIWTAIQRTVFVFQNLNWEEYLIFFPWRKLWTGSIFGIALAGPIIHLGAMKRLFRVSYTHGLSLAMDMNDFQRSLSTNENDSAIKRQLLWRWKLVWRDPRRILVTINEYRERFWYWFLFSGSVAEKLRIVEQEGRKHEEAASNKLKILQRVAEDRKRNPDAPLPDRTKWKQNAMNALAERHQKDYESWKKMGDTANRQNTGDPLGIALQQALGIGLGFNFDHMNKDSEIPLTRRLQARAAKSAIKRVQELYDADKASKELDSITDPLQREIRASELRKTVDNEVAFLAERLSNLIPTDLSLPFPSDAKLYQFNNMDMYQRTSDNEFVLSTPFERSPTIENLRKSIRERSFQDVPDYLDPWANESSDKTDDEFIKEWLKHSEKPKTSSHLNSDQDDEKEIETYLA